MRQNHSTRMSANAARTERLIREGSALVLVIGALALISVFAAIYLAIGRSDRQNASALKQRADINEYSEYFSSYIAGVIGDDRMDVYPILSLNTRGGAEEFHREVTDFPYTDWNVRSQPANKLERFFPSGRHTEFSADPNDTRVPYDPWLATTMPEYLGSENIGDTAGNARYYSASFGANTLRNGRRFLDNRDWRQISNFAPDARFVNLWNLRPGEDNETNTYGGFDAKPGLGTYTEKGIAKTKTRRSMTYGISLLQRRGNSPYLEAFDPTETGLAWMQGYDLPQPVARALGVTNQELANVPAVWTMNQRYLFTPANQPFVTYERRSRWNNNSGAAQGIANWTSPDFMPYQYADADGDGMYDSRWIELIDASDANAFKNLLPFPIDDLRLFAAIRVEDLSARVNVNVAGDSLIAPSVDYPVGLVPTEIDLRRLLSMEDPSLETGIDLSELDVLPTGSDAVQNYQEYDYFTNKVNARGFFYAGGGSPSNFINSIGRRMGDVSVAEEVGRLAYDAIRVAIETADAPNEAFFGPKRAQNGTAFEPVLARTDLISGSRFFFTPVKNATDGAYGEWVVNDPSQSETPTKQRVDYYYQVGGNLPKSSRDKISPLSVDKTGEVFGLDDLAELLTFKGLNDPRVMSRLELTTSGRADLDPTQMNTPSRNELRQASRRFDPLISNRSLEIDRFGHGDGRRTQPNPDAMLFGDPLMTLGPRVSGTVDPDAMFLLYASPRLHLTTYSGATPLPIGSSVTLDPLTLRVPPLQEEKLARSLRSLVGSTQTAFNTYAQALLKDSSIDDFSAWRNELETYMPRDSLYAPRPVDTAFYGYRGPELALRLAAHLAVNLQDMVDDDSTPTAATLLIDQDARNGQLGPDGLSQDDYPVQPYPWLYNNQGRTIRPAGSLLAGELRIGLDYGLDKLPGATGQYLDPSLDGEKHRRAVNVFGVEPQPVLTEVAILNVFTDAPQLAGGDVDSSTLIDAGGGLIAVKRTGDLEGGGGNGGQSGPAFMTLKTSVPDTDYGTNPDFLMQAMVFQVHNPYPEAITFVGAPPPTTGSPTLPDTIQFSHYLEYAGRFFRLGSYSETESDDTVVPPAEPREKPVLDARLRYQPVTLQAGETAVFYALMNEEPANGIEYDWDRIERRVARILDTDGYDDLSRYSYGSTAIPDNVGDDSNQYSGLMQEWFESNLKDDGGVSQQYPMQVHRVREISPATGDYVAGTRNYRNLAKKNVLAIEDYKGLGRVNVTSRTAALPDDWSVRLWRTMRTGAEAVDGTNPANDNVISNDFLCDRLVVGQRLLQEFNNANTGEIRNTVSLDKAFFDPYENSALVWNYSGGVLRFERNDNTGWTVAQWAGVRRSGRETTEFASPAGELIRGVVSPAMIASDVVEDEVDPKRSDRRRRVDQWSQTSGYPSIDQIEDLAQVAEFKLIDSPNFKYRLIDLLAMKPKVPDEVTGFPKYAPFLPADDNSGAYVGDTKKGPVLQGMALQPYVKFDGLGSLNSTIAYYDGDTSPIVDSEMDLPVVNSSVLGAPDYRLDYSDSDFDPDSKNLERVNPDVAFGLKNTTKDAAAGIAPRYVMRPTDLLTPFAVGPVHSPTFDSGLNSADRSNASQNFDPDAEWVTFPEMLSIALGYRDVSPVTAALPGNNAIEQLYGLLWQEERDLTWKPALDSGKLRLDDYIRFFDIDGLDTQIDPLAADFPGNFTSGIDRRRGSGIPMALELLGDVRGVGSDMREIGFLVGVASSIGEGSVQLPEYSYNERFDGRTDMVVGKININTAPESVLRLLPGLAPSAEFYDPNRDSGYGVPPPPQFSNDWTVGYRAAGPSMAENLSDSDQVTPYGTPRPDPFVLDNVLDSVRDTPDRAALLTAYRDRKRAWPRMMSDPVSVDVAKFALGADYTPFTVDSPVPWRRLSFYDNDPARTPLLTGVELQINNYVTDRSRQIITGIPGLREMPGFSSPGEVLAVTLRRDDALETGPGSTEIPKEGRDAVSLGTGNDTNVFDFNRHNVMTGLGYDGNSLKTDKPYYSSDVASYDTSIYKDGENDSVVDEADERIAIAGAIMNSIDVRSDTYAVWFVLQGYRPEDVADLRPTDPLVPSFQRRYMMVLDRSNVVSENDQPKIVMIREVPM